MNICNNLNLVNILEFPYFLHKVNKYLNEASYTYLPSPLRKINSYRKETGKLNPRLPFEAVGKMYADKVNSVFSK